MQLKPCPFCGGEAKILRDTEYRNDLYVQCRSCTASMCESPEGLAPAWNRRAPDPAAVAAYTHAVEEAARYKAMAERMGAVVEAARKWNKGGMRAVDLSILVEKYEEGSNGK